MKRLKKLSWLIAIAALLLLGTGFGYAAPMGLLAVELLCFGVVFHCLDTQRIGRDCADRIANCRPKVKSVSARSIVLPLIGVLLLAGCEGPQPTPVAMVRNRPNVMVNVGPYGRGYYAPPYVNFGPYGYPPYRGCSPYGCPNNFHYGYRGLHHNHHR